MFKKISKDIAKSSLEVAAKTGYINDSSPLYFFGIKQNTKEWDEARQGIPTVSAFSRIMTPKFALSSQSTGYIGELLAVGVADESEENRFYSGNMKEGHKRESEALSYYSFVEGVETTECGIVYRDSSYSVSCSPDSLVGDRGGVELKNPMLKTHISTLASNDIPAEHLPQLYGSLYVTGRDWWDFVSYHPKANTFIKRVYATDTVIIKGKKVLILELINDAVTLFNRRLEKVRLLAYS